MLSQVPVHHHQGAIVSTMKPRVSVALAFRENAVGSQVEMGQAVKKMLSYSAEKV